MKGFNKKDVADLRAAMTMASVSVDNGTAELILIVQRDLKRLHGKYSLRDASAAVAYISRKYRPTFNDEVDKRLQHHKLIKPNITTQQVFRKLSKKKK